MKKQLLINKDILQKDDRISVEAFLKRRQIPYEFMDDITASNRFRDEPMLKFLVVDCTTLRAKGDTPIPEMYRMPNVYIVRAVDLVKDSHRKNMHMDTYKFLVDKLGAIHQMLVITMNIIYKYLTDVNM